MKAVKKSLGVVNYIRNELELIEQYWKQVGLDEYEIDCLIQLEIDEDNEREWYVSRRWMYDRGLIGIEDILNSIEKWERVNKWRLEWIG